MNALVRGRHQARPFDPRMNGRREVPGWVLALVAVLLVMATAAVEGSTPRTLAAFFHLVGQVALGVLVVIAVLAGVGLWLGVIVHCWRRMDGPR